MLYHNKNSFLSCQAQGGYVKLVAENKKSSNYFSAYEFLVNGWCY